MYTQVHYSTCIKYLYQLLPSAHWPCFVFLETPLLTQDLSLSPEITYSIYTVKKITCTCTCTWTTSSIKINLDKKHITCIYNHRVTQHTCTKNCYSSLSFSSKLSVTIYVAKDYIVHDYGARSLRMTIACTQKGTHTCTCTYMYTRIVNSGTPPFQTPLKLSQGCLSSVLINYILGEVLYNVAGTMHGVLIKGDILISGVSLYMYNTHAHSYCIQIHSHTYTYMYCS